MGIVGTPGTRRRYSAAALLCLSALSCGCGSPSGEGPGALDGTGGERDAILEQYAAMKAEAGGALQPDAILTGMVQAVVAAGLAQDEPSAAGYLIDRYQDGELGLAVTQAYLGRLFSQEKGQALEYSRALIRDHGDAPTSACALDFVLECMRKQSPDAYLKTCEEAIGEDTDRLKRIALLSRINYYHDGGEHKLAALDTLRFWRLCPEKVESAQLGPFFCGNLERAGWLLEADIMAASPQAGPDAGMLLDLMEAIGLESALHTGRAEDGLQGLYLDAPDVAAILERCKPETLSKTDLAIVLLHCSRLELTQINDRRTMPSLPGYYDVVEALLSEGDTDLAYLRLLNRGAARAVSNYLRVFGETEAFASSYLGAGCLRELKKASTGLARMQVRLCRSELLIEGTPCGIERLSTFLEEIDEPWVCAETLEAFLASNPATAAASSLRMKLAKLQRDKLGQSQKAAENLLRVFHEAPEETESIRAALLACISLVQEGQNETALTHLRELGTVLDKDAPNYPLVLYLTGVCEHSLGFREEAEARLEGLLQDYPASAVGAKALWWMGSAKLSDQRYREALVDFRDLLERYPESSEAERAKQYIERLQNVPEETP